MNATAASADAAAQKRAAAALQDEGRLEEARDLFQRAVRAAPLEADGWVGLAGCLLLSRRPETALQVCDAGLERLPAAATLICARARVLQSLSRVGEAAEAYRAALASDPASAEARFGLALQAAEAGDWADAADLVAALPPSPALDWLAARIALGLGDPETARTKVTQALASPGLSPDQQAEVALLLGEALDALGRPAEAFAAFAHGKQALRGLYAERAAGRESEVGKLNRLADWFAAADPAPWRVAPVETPASAATPSWSASRVPARRCWSRRSPAIRISSAWRRRRRWPRPTMR